jgi:hypothetical protein
MRFLIHSSAGLLFRRTPSLVAGVAILSLVPMVARADEVVRVPWEGLSMTVGKTVLVATPRGPVMTGKVTAVEPDALVVQVTKTNDRSVRVKGELRVPRATLRVVRIQTKGVLYRAAGAFLGASAGFVSGTAARTLSTGTATMTTAPAPWSLGPEPPESHSDIWRAITRIGGGPPSRSCRRRFQ